MSKDIEKKWQKKWKEAKIFESNPDNREKLFLTVAYPYPSGSMHVGHGRTYTVPDVYARFKRMQGYNVLFPMAWHVTGAPVIGIAKRIEGKDEKTLNLYQNLYKVPSTEIESFKEPQNIVKYFSTQYHHDMDNMGYSIDWRREFRTTDPTYQKFVEWQIRKLRDQEYVRKGSHPVKYCPDCQNPVGDHDLLEGEGVAVNELTILKFKKDDKYLVTGTFRPETIYGATNLWMNPDIEYIEVKDQDTNETWIISKESYYNISHQKKNLKIIKDIDTGDYIGQTVTNLETNEEHPILPASFVDPEYGTGVVFSVPGHAPADYIALQDIKKDQELLEKYNLKEIVEKIEPKNVVSNKKYGEIPAKEVIENFNITSQDDPKLPDATNELYKVEHSKGRISKHIEEYAGQPVKFARNTIAKKLKEEGKADTIYDFAERPVICRCGTKCVVRLMDNQWFLRYSDEDWKNKTRNCLEQAQIIPKEIRSNFDYYIGWLEDWACSRRIGLGTRLPWDNQWLIEPLTDSTIYMSYYTIAKYLKDINPEDLNDAFFNKVFLNNQLPTNTPVEGGDIKINTELIEKIQEEHNYWYPLDWRLSAKDLIGNHLTFHMFHHATIFPENKWPQGIVVFGMGLLEGNKMSSSKGNVILLSDAIDKYGADVVRLFLMSSAEPWQDFDWRDKEVKGTQRRLEWFKEFTEEISTLIGGLNISQIKKIHVEDTINLWLLNQLNTHIQEATNVLEKFQTRKAVQESLFLLKKDVDHYMYRLTPEQKNTEETKYTLSILIDSWIRLLAPFTPHISEELWHKYGGEGFVSQAPWPEANTKFINDKIQKAEEITETLVSDIKNIQKIVDTPAEKIHVYLAPEWKWKVYDIAKEIGKPDIGQIMGRSIKENVCDDKKAIANYAKKIGREMTKVKYVGKIDESSILENAKNYIESEIGCEINIHTDDSYDPENKAQNAIPYKPAIYIE